MRTVQLLERIAALDTRGAVFVMPPWSICWLNCLSTFQHCWRCWKRHVTHQPVWKTRRCPWGSTCQLQTRLLAARWQTAYPLPFMPSGVDGEPLNPNRH